MPIVLYKPRRAVTWLLGLFLLGFLYYPLKRWAPNDWIFLLVALAYVVLLRLLAERIGRT
jgi:hypothetical protein